MIITFKFKQRSDLTGKTCVFDIDGLNVSDDTVEYEDITFDIGDKPYHGDFSSFTSNHVGTDEVFEGVLNAYLRNDAEDFEYLEGWEAFELLKNKQVYNGELLIEFPQVNYVDIEMYALDLAVPEGRFYAAYDNVLLLSEGGSIATDIDAFYMNALIDELKKLEKNGYSSCIYMSDQLKKYKEELLG